MDAPWNATKLFEMKSCDIVATKWDKDKYQIISLICSIQKNKARERPVSNGNNHLALNDNLEITQEWGKEKSGKEKKIIPEVAQTQ